MGRPVIDLTGQKFGRLTVIKYAGSNADGRSVWYCECSCGNTTRTVGQDMRRGQALSCGCKRLERKDLTGRKFGEWTVTGHANKRKWHCSCSCGATSVVDGGV